MPIFLFRAGSDTDLNELKRHETNIKQKSRVGLGAVVALIRVISKFPKKFKTSQIYFCNQYDDLKSCLQRGVYVVIAIET